VGRVGGKRGAKVVVDDEEVVAAVEDGKTGEDRESFRERLDLRESRSSISGFLRARALPLGSLSFAET